MKIKCLFITVMALVALNVMPIANASLLGPSSYLSFADSPFYSGSFSYFYLETFEDHLLNTLGVTASAGGVTSMVYGPDIHDSVDADNGTIDGSGLAGDSFFGNGPIGISFTFNAGSLGSLPTDVGIVWTDGAGTTSFEAFDASDNSLGVIGPVAIADGSNNGETAEDRFFGISYSGGIARIVISNSIDGMEVDHLQYGKALVTVPEPATMLLLGFGLLGLAGIRRKFKS